ncbi:nucleoporin 88-like [Uloborus diversus]|uniref:nucleoporin 88-like n=1 Tax=Uloborus diversus TaxID=327109 RepID=UPI00240A96D6|nr:nucleoporin 88-like [Uloborus diversus]
MAANVNEQILSSGILSKLKLNEKKYKNLKESKSLLAIYEQHVFVWHDVGSCLLTAEMNASESKSSSFMTLTLSNPPVFEVESILFNQTGSLLSLTGKNGVMVFQVPWRYGKFGATGDKNEAIVGRSWNVAEYFFVCSNRISVVQALWHPGSSSNTHLTVLSTDNYIRIYDVTEPQTPTQVISLGASARSSYLSSEAKISFSTCFGENAVSFDFGLPVKIQVQLQSESRGVKMFGEQTIWPIFLLHGNGDVYILKVPLKKERVLSVAKLEGPLAMYPPAEDNYGYDACCILCLHSTPLSIVVATSNGMIYHCIVLGNSSSTSVKQQVEEASSFEVSDKCDSALYVFESVELPLTLSDEQDDVYGHPILLYKDVTSHSKYHCTHASGLHSVAVPFLQAIEECLNADGLSKLLYEDQKQPCIVEHILCTKPFSQMEAVPVLGLDVSVSDAGVIMICLLASFEFVCLPLVSSYFATAPHLLGDDLLLVKDQDKSISSFEQHIEKSLQRSLCSPFIKSTSGKDKVHTSPHQWLDLLCNVTQRYREDYIQRLNTALALLRSRVKVLTQQKEYQLMDIARCNQEKETLKNGAERLAEKYEDAQAAQQKIFVRVENLLQKLTQNLPYLSKAEIDMKQTLLSYEEKLKNFETSLDQIKKKVKYQREKMKELGDTHHQVQTTKEMLTDLNLNDTQLKHVKELLSQEGDSISDLVQTITSLKKQTAL